MDVCVWQLRRKVDSSDSRCAPTQVRVQSAGCSSAGAASLARRPVPSLTTSALGSAPLFPASVRALASSGKLSAFACNNTSQ